MSGILEKVNLGGMRFKTTPGSTLRPPPIKKKILQVSPHHSTISVIQPGHPDFEIPPVIKRGYTGPIYTASNWIEKFFYDPTTVTMVGKHWDFEGAETIKLDSIQRRILDHVLAPDENGLLPYSEVVYSTIKKEGKTTLAGGVGAYFSAQLEPPNLTLCLANDREQSAGRIFGAMLPTFYKINKGLRIPLSQSSPPIIKLDNGTIIQAIANNYAGNAGANYSLTLWSELWAYATERSRRLFDELIPVPTRKNSIRWVETYVGFEDESDLLLDVFLRIFTDTDESGIQPKAKPVPQLIDIVSDGKPTCWHIPEEGLFYFHNHEPRMPWNIGEKGEKYRSSQKAQLRHSTYVRLHENRWQSSEGNLIHPDLYDDAITLIDQPNEAPMFLAGDASQRNDTMVLVGVQKYSRIVWGEEQERYRLVYCSVWDPKIHGLKKGNSLGGKKGDMDLDETIALEVLRLHRSGYLIGPMRYDPYQMHTVASNLRKKAVPCYEFSQQTDRLKADTFLVKLLTKGLLDMYYHPVLEKHIKGAKGKEYDNEQIRIVKGTHNRANKVDGAVALAMACYAASQFRPVVHKKRSSSSRTLL